MMNMKKMLALLLAVVMVVGMIPFGAMAEEAEPVTHIETCLEGCVLEDCACTCHAAPETPAEEPKQEQPPVGPASLDDTQTQETPVCTCTPVEGVHAEACALYVKPEEKPVPEMTEEEVAALYSALMACDTLESINAAAEKITEEKAEYFFNALTEEQIKELNDHFLAIFEDIYPSKEPVTQESVIVYPTVGNTNVAPFLKPVKAAPIMRMFAFKAAPVAEETFDNGLELDKKVSGPVNGVYTLTLDAYATGSKTITEETKTVPTDIVLVLDQSGSMAYDFTVTNYDEFNNKSPEEYYQQQLKSLYVKLEDGSYASVIVKKNVELTSPTAVSGKSNSYYKDLADDGKLYHHCSDGTYGILSCDDFNFLIGHYYQYTCEKCGETSNGLHFLAWDTSTPNNNSEFYTTSSATTMYTFSYVDQNGETVVSGPATTAPAGWDFWIAGTASSSTRLAALKDAVTTFTTNVKNKAVADNVSHRIAIVGFASVSGNGNNSEVLTLSGNNSGSVGISYSELTSDNDYYEGALQDMSTSGGQTMVTNAINALAAQGATRVDIGMEMANKIFEKNPIPAGEERNRVIIVFTDGVPTTSNSYSDTVATSAITYGNTAKSDYGATIYTVGIFDGADSTKDGSNSNNASETQKANWFMHRLSSNTKYPQSPTYYLTASNSDDLTNIFVKISQNIETGGASITLNKEAVVKDVITDQFVLPNGADTDQIKVYSVACTGADANGNLTFDDKDLDDDDLFADAVVDINEQTVTVTNFDFAENWCGTETVNGEPSYRGNKLVIEIPVKLRDGFLGGNNILTNGEGSGLYESDTASTPVEEFVSPTVDVEVATVTVTAPNCSVYLLGDVAADTLKNGLIVKVKPVKGDEITLNMDAENYGLAAWQNAYVTINDPTAQGALSDLINDTTYSATVTISHDPEGTVIATSGTGTGNVYVFKPYIVYQDSSIVANNTPDYETDNFVSVTWKHVQTVDGNLVETVAPDTMGVAPTLIYTYEPAEKVLNVETNVKASVAIRAADGKDTDVTEYVTFWRNECTAENGCNFKGGAVDAKNANRINFVVHMKTFDLIIEKKGVNENLDGNAPFVFNVSGKGVNMNVVIYGEDSVTIKNLPAGEYVVSEVGGYWRYNVSDAKYSVEGGKVSATVPAVVVTNTRGTDKWLDDWAKATNRFGVGADLDSGIID